MAEETVSLSNVNKFGGFQKPSLIDFVLDYADELKLTAEQKIKIEIIRTKIFNETYTDADGKVEDILTSEQKNALNNTLALELPQTRYFSPGYKVIFKELNKKPKTQPTFPALYSDPRGDLKELVPANSFSYEIFEDIKSFGTVRRNININAGSFGTLGAGFAGIGGAAVTASEPTQLILNAVSRTCLIGFEGHDVVDAPTKDMIKGGNISCPTNVFYPIYSGSKFIAKKDDKFPVKTALEYNKKSPENGIKGMIPSDYLPLDSVLNEKGLFSPVARAAYKGGIDTGSNLINGSGEFVSYVAIDKPIFRDVIVSAYSTLVQGILFGDSFSDRFSSGYFFSVYVIRYSMINSGTNESPNFRWKMTESFGIDVENKIETPISAYKKYSDMINKSEHAKHYVYNTNEEGDELKVDFIKSTPLKKAYSTGHALSMMDPSDSLYDPNFNGVVSNIKKGSVFAQSNLQLKDFSVLLGGSPISLTGMSQKRTYTSPIFDVNYNENFRLGVEYSVLRNPSNGSLAAVQYPNKITLLVKTKPSTHGIGAYHDPCIDAIITVSVDGGTATQRVFGDSGWTTKALAPVQGFLKAFLVGEFPYKTGGASCLFPRQESKGDIEFKPGTAGNIKVSSTVTVTSVVVSLPEVINIESPPVLSFSQGLEEAVLEIQLPSQNERGEKEMQIQIPPFDYSKFDIKNASGATVKAFYYAKKAKFLESLEKITPVDSDVLFSQISEIKEDEYPILASSATVASLNEFGNSFIAFSTENTIHFGFRSCYSHPYSLVRDVILRFPENKTESTQRAVATGPFLIADPDTDSAYLFYLYKGRIVLKIIPYEMFIPLKETDYGVNGYTPQTEANLIAKMYRLGARVCYDGYIKDKKDKIQEDLESGYLSVNNNDKDSGLGTDETNLSHFSACLGNQGHYLAIEDGMHLILRKSFDKCKTWSDIFSPGARLIKAANDSDLADQDGTYPMIFCDKSTGIVFLFMCIETSLVMMRIPEEILLNDQRRASEIIKNIEVELIFGVLSEDMEKRGIIASNAVKEREKMDKGKSETGGTVSEPEEIPPQRVAVAKTEFGSLRLFYVDDELLMRSLISSDAGRTWLTEKQFINKYS